MSVDKKRQAILFAACVLIYSEQCANSVPWACKKKAETRLFCTLCLKLTLPNLTLEGNSVIGSIYHFLTHAN